MVYTGFVKSLFLSESSYWFRLNNIIPTSFWSVFIKPSILFVFVFLFPRHNLFWWTLRIPSDRFCLIYHWLNINHMEIEELCCRRSVLSGLRRKFTAKILSEEMELKWGWELLLLFEEIYGRLKNITQLAPLQNVFGFERSKNKWPFSSWSWSFSNWIYIYRDGAWSLCSWHRW